MTERFSRQQGSASDYIARNTRALRRHAVAAVGFDPNADPVVIGQTAIADATGPTGSSSPTTDGAVAIGRDAHTENSAAVAIGDSAFAAGQYSTVIGDHADAEGIKWDIAIGHLAQASWATGAQQSIAIGANAHAGGTTTNTLRDIAIGVSAVADGGSAIAIGGTAAASAIDAVAIGDHSAASGFYTVALGYLAAASGTQSSALGSAAAASATGATAVGRQTVASATDSCALGTAASASHGGSTAIGLSAATTLGNQVMLGSAITYTEIVSTSHPGIFIHSANGSRWQCAPDNSGVWTVTAA